MVAPPGESIKPYKTNWSQYSRFCYDKVVKWNLGVRIRIYGDLE